MRILTFLVGAIFWSSIALGDIIKSQAFDADVSKNEVEAQTFDTMEVPVKYPTGLKLEKGWEKKVKIQDVTAQAALPRNFDWREQGQLTPAKNQGSCGSCWAFSTVATFQDVMSLRNKGQIRLSEQYLLSCAGPKEGWSCNGGFFAHDYHVSPGAVPEAEFPYYGREVACKTSLSHPYKLASWAYLPSSNGNSPSIESIKNAIYQYGPVSAAVGASDSFMSYRSGVFNNCDGTNPNHAITLVGWNDDGQYFIMKNSWGTSWGDNGFMKIKYNCNYIGYAANYVVFNSNTPTPKPTPEPVPKCSPEPYANAGRDVTVRRGRYIRLGTPARPYTTYHWESSADRTSLKSAQIIIRPRVSQTFTVYATTKCGTANSSVRVTVR